MEEIYSPAPASCTDELTRSDSRSDSGASSLTTEDILHQEANLTPCECAAWANEKHDHYLNRLESSFVNQLHQSIGQHSSRPEQGKNARNSTMKQPASSLSKQFTVLRDGCWQKINYGKTTGAGFRNILRSPCVNHLQHEAQPCSTRSSYPQELCQVWQEENLLREERPNISSHRERRYRRDLPVNYTPHCDLDGSCAEGSGQNFTDEGDDSKPRSKKLKTAIADASNADQTVPSWELLPSSEK